MQHTVGSKHAHSKRTNPVCKDKSTVANTHAGEHTVEKPLHALKHFLICMSSFARIQFNHSFLHNILWACAREITSYISSTHKTILKIILFYITVYPFKHPFPRTINYQMNLLQTQNKKISLSSSVVCVHFIYVFMRSYLLYPSLCICQIYN